MAMGKRGPRKRQSSMWVASSELPRSAGNPFYERLNRVLDEAGFDAFVEEQWAKFYADSLGPAEPGAGLAARRFAEPSTIPGLSSCTKPRRIDLETHQAGAAWVSSTRGGHRRCPCRPYPAPGRRPGRPPRPYRRSLAKGAACRRPARRAASSCFSRRSLRRFHRSRSRIVRAKFSLSLTFSRSPGPYSKYRHSAAVTEGRLPKRTKDVTPMTRTQILALTALLAMPHVTIAQQHNPDPAIPGYNLVPNHTPVGRGGASGDCGLRTSSGACFLDSLAFKLGTTNPAQRPGILEGALEHTRSMALTQTTREPLRREVGGVNKKWLVAGLALTTWGSLLMTDGSLQEEEELLSIGILAGGVVMVANQLMNIGTGRTELTDAGRRQRQAELARQRQAELARQRQAEQARQRAAQLARQREAEQEAARARQRAAEQARQREAELARQREREAAEERRAREEAERATAEEREAEREAAEERRAQEEADEATRRAEELRARIAELERQQQERERDR